MECPLCNNNIDPSKYVDNHLSQQNRTEYKLYACSNCKNGFWWPLIGQAGSNYANDNNYGNRHETYDFFELSQNQKIFFNLMPQKTGKLLDVGCAEGSFLNYAKKSYDPYGIDFDEKSISAGKKLGLKNIHALDMENIHKANFPKFDIITFFEVMEHQQNPAHFISEIKKLSSSDGFIAGSVPFHETVIPRNHTSDCPPHHFLIFTEIGLKNFLTQNGFTNILIKPVHFYSPADYLRMSSSISGTNVKKILASSSNLSKSPLKLKFYLLIRKLKPFILPILNLPFAIKYMFMEKQKKQQIELEVTTIYFQAKLNKKN